MKTKKTITFILNEEETITIIKPFSEEYKNRLFTVHEDAYGEVHFKIELINDDLRVKLNLNNKKFKKIIAQL